MECLNIVGRQSGVFPWQGCAIVGELIPKSHTVSVGILCMRYGSRVSAGKHWGVPQQVFFEECNHWLYIEEPEKFNHILVTFATEGLGAVRHLTCV